MPGRKGHIVFPVRTKNTAKRLQQDLLLKRHREWRRIFRYEGARDPGRLEEHFRGKKEYKAADSQALWPYYRTSLKEVEKILGFNISRFVRGRVARHTTANPFKVLDLGCGNGASLLELKGKFGGRLRAVGMVLKKAPWEKYKGVDRVIEGDAASANPREQFDLVYSSFGGIYHSPMKTTALSRLISWMRPGGIAVIHLGPGSMLDKFIEEARTLCWQNGISATKKRSRKGIIFILRKPKIKLPG